MITISQPAAIVFAAAFVLALLLAVLFWRGLRAERAYSLRQLERHLTLLGDYFRLLKANRENVAICQRQSTLLMQYADRNDELAAKLAAYDLEYGDEQALEERLAGAVTGVGG